MEKKSGKKRRKKMGAPGIALVIGRFQPLHKGHLHAIGDILRENGKLIMLIGSAQAARMPTNPFTADERIEMISECLLRHGLLEKIMMKKLNDEAHHSAWVKKVISTAGEADILYSGNELVRELLKNNFEVRNMTSDVDISGTRIRKMYRNGNRKWRDFVPEEVITYLEGHNLLKYI